MGRSALVENDQCNMRACVCVHIEWKTRETNQNDIYIYKLPKKMRIRQASRTKKADVCVCWSKELPTAFMQSE